MRRIAVLLALAAPLLVARAALAVTVDDVIAMVQAGVSVDIIVETIKEEPVAVTPADLARLRAAKVPEKVIQALQGAAPPPPTQPASDSALGRARRAAEEFRRAEQERRAREAREAEEARTREAARLRREAAKLRREAAEMAREAKSAEATADARAQLIDGVLRDGMAKVGRGQYALAAARLHDFLRGGLVPPNSYRYVDGEYGLAEALFGAGLYQAAAPHYVEVLRRGTATRRFAPAFRRLCDIAEHTEYTHPVYEMLATLDVSGAGADFADEYHFALGEFYERYGTPKTAREHFARVSERSRRYPAASYHAGLILVTEKQNKRALRAFERAVVAAERMGQDDVRDLGLMALARIAFEVGSWDAARAYYGRITLRSRAYPRARYELLWAQFLAEDYRAALGTLQTMFAPQFRDDYLPDLFIVEATIYLNLCRFDEAREALAAFRTRTTDLGRKVKRFLDAKPAPQAVIDAVLGTSPGVLPESVRRHVLADIDFYSALNTYVDLRRELAALERRDFGTFAAAARPQLEERLAAYRELAGVAGLKRLRDTHGDLVDLSIKANEIRFEIDLAEKERLADETLALYQGGAGSATKQPAGPRRESPALGPTDELWPDEGEYWEDEIPYYRSFLRGACGEKK